MADTPSNRMVELITSSAKHRPPLITDPEMFRPLIFPKHDRRMRIAFNAIGWGLFCYGVLFCDFGPQEHCFSPIRRYVFGKVNSLFTVRPEDEVYLQQRVETIKAQVDQVNAEKAKATPAL